MDNTPKTENKKQVSLSGRPARKRVGSASRLKFNNLDTENFRYRIVNDTPDRIAMFKDAGYEVVSAEEAGLEKSRLDSGKGTDGLISVGGGTKALLMKQRLDFYEEDQAEKAQVVDNAMAAIEDGPNQEGHYGSVEYK